MTVLRSTEYVGTFRVTYSTVTEQSCEIGDRADCGYVDAAGSPIDDPQDSKWTFRELLDRFQGYLPEGDGSPAPRWLTVTAESDLWLDSFWANLGEDLIGAECSIHCPDWITESSWIRVCRAIGWTWKY